MNSYKLDFAKATQRSENCNERLFLSILEKYQKVIFSWTCASLTVYDESMDIDQPEAYQQISVFRLFELFDINIEPMSPLRLPFAARYVSPKNLFVLFVLEKNRITTKVNDMTLESNYASEILKRISKIDE